MPKGLSSKNFKPRKGDTIKGAKMPSIHKHVQQAGTHTLKETTGIIDAFLYGMNKRKNSAAERAIGKSQLKRFLANPRKFRGGPAARKKK